MNDSDTRPKLVEGQHSREVTAQDPAREWLQVTENLILARVSQYQELGHPDSHSEDFLGAQRAVLDMLREGVENSDPHVIELLQSFEAFAEQTGDSMPNYLLIHVKQLDSLAGIVESHN